MSAYSKSGGIKDVYMQAFPSQFVFEMPQAIKKDIYFIWNLAYVFVPLGFVLKSDS